MSTVNVQVRLPVDTLNALAAIAEHNGRTMNEEAVVMLRQFCNRFSPLHTGDITSWVVIDGDTHEEIIRMSTREEAREHIRSLGCNARLGCTRVAK